MPTGEPSRNAAQDDAPSGLGQIFDEDAATYDEMRPTYPPDVFQDLVRIGSLRPGARVLEIGAGTGQATVDLARRGLDVVALEPGANLARIAIEKLRAFSGAHVEISTFEDWRPPARSFDAVVAATSFHWLDPATRLSKSGHVLRPGGVLAIVSTHHVAGGTSRFFDEVQRCYEEHMPGTQTGLRLPSEEAVLAHEVDLRLPGVLTPVHRSGYVQDETYSSSEYLRLLTTYSGHRALDRPSREQLFACVRRLIEDRFAGSITKRYLFRLTMAARTETA